MLFFSCHYAANYALKVAKMGKCVVVVVAGRHACGCVPSPSLANTLSHTIDLIDLARRIDVAEAGG